MSNLENTVVKKMTLALVASVAVVLTLAIINGELNRTRLNSKFKVSPISKTPQASVDIKVESVKLLIEDLRSESAESTETAVSRLVDIGPEAIPPLIAALNSKHAEIRFGAIKALGLMGAIAAEATPKIVELLDDPNICVVHQSLSFLGIMKFQSAIAISRISQFMYSDDKNLRLSAVEALTQIGNSDCIAQLELFALDKSDQVSFEAVVALIELEAVNANSLRILSGLMNGPNKYYKVKAMAAIENHGAKMVDILPIVRGRLSDENSAVRAAAARALARIRAPNR